MKSKHCEKHQNYKYINVCLVCFITDERNKLKIENEAMRTALKEIWTSEFINWGEGSDFQKYVDEQFKKLNL